MITSSLTKKKVAASHYEFFDGETKVATVVRTGEHGRDNYPWDWYFEVGVLETTKRTQGNTDNMADADEQVRLLWNEQQATVAAKKVYDHPATIVENAEGGSTVDSRLHARRLRAYEKDHDVTFAALDNDALKAVREAYAADDDETLHDAVRDLLGLEG